MSRTEDFENAPIGATATNDGGSRAMKMDNVERRWMLPNGLDVAEGAMERWGYTLDSSVPATAREALDLAWELAHEVKPGQVIPKGTRYLEDQGSGLKENRARCDFNISPGLAPIVRTLEPLPDPEPDWLDAPAVIAETSMCPDRKVWTPESGGVWKCSCCRDEIHWYELIDVTPLYPKEGQEA